MMSDDIRLAIKRLVDGQGRQQWNDSETTLKGYPVYVNEHMASAPVSGAKTILFGNLKKYKVRMHHIVRVVHLAQRYRLSDLDGFVAYIEADGGLLDAAASDSLKPIKVLTH